MTHINVQRYSRMLQMRRTELSIEIDQLQKSEQEHGTMTAAVTRELEEAQRLLTEALLPSLDSQVLQAAGAWAGLPQLANTLLQEMNSDRQRSEQALAALNNDDEFQRREELIHPDHGTLVLARQEVGHHLDALEPLLRKCESHPRWRRLLQAAYGTPDYSVGWWRISYYSDWKAGDEILDRFPGLSFEQIRSQYLEADSARQVLQQRKQAVLDEFMRVQQKVDEHVRLTSHLQQLHSTYLLKAREQLAEQLSQLPPDLLADRARSWPAGQLLLARFSGLRAKWDYLHGIQNLQIRPLLNSLREEYRKLERQYYKYQRPKNANARFPLDKAEKSLVQRGQKVQQRMQHAQQLKQRVYAFDQYQLVQWVGPILWWDIFTDGRLDGSFLPEVARFRQMHPDYRFKRPKDSGQAESEAAAIHSQVTSQAWKDDLDLS